MLKSDMKSCPSTTDPFLPGWMRHCVVIRLFSFKIFVIKVIPPTSHSVPDQSFSAGRPSQVLFSLENKLRWPNYFGSILLCAYQIPPPECSRSSPSVKCLAFFECWHGIYF